MSGFDDRISEKVAPQKFDDLGFGSFEENRRKSENVVSQNEKNIMQKSVEKLQEKPSVSYETLMTDVGNLMEISREFMKIVH